MNLESLSMSPQSNAMGGSSPWQGLLTESAISADFMALLQSVVSSVDSPLKGVQGVQGQDVLANLLSSEQSHNSTDLAESLLANLDQSVQDLIMNSLQDLVPEIDLQNIEAGDEQAVLMAVEELMRQLLQKLSQWVFPQRSSESASIDLESKLMIMSDQTQKDSLQQIAKLKEMIALLGNMQHALKNSLEENTQSLLQKTESAETLLNKQASSKELNQKSQLDSQLNQDSFSDFDTQELKIFAEADNSEVLESQQNQIDDSLSIAKPETGRENNLNQQSQGNKNSQQDMLLDVKSSGDGINKTESKQIDILPNESSKILDLKTEQGSASLGDRHATVKEVHNQLTDKAMSKSMDMESRIETFRVVQQVGNRVQILIHKGEGKAIMRLDPPELGHVELEVEYKPGELKVHMLVESKEAKSFLESNIAQLRESLDKQQIQIQKLEVTVDQGKTMDTGREFEKEAQAMARKGFGTKKNRGMRFAEAILMDDSGPDTGRRFGYNTMEIIA